MYPDDESSEEYPDNTYLDDLYEEEDQQGSSFGKGCLIAIAIILILSLIIRAFL